jgi:hypothetical protein
MKPRRRCGPGEKHEDRERKDKTQPNARSGSSICHKDYTDGDNEDEEERGGGAAVCRRAFAASAAVNADDDEDSGETACAISISV